jgi:hypothetical protein
MRQQKMHRVRSPCGPLTLSEPESPLAIVCGVNNLRRPIKYWEYSDLAAFVELFLLAA